MGGGSWSSDDYVKSLAGSSAFKFSHDVMSKPREERQCHQMLNPFGLTVRESRDSAEHPESNAVIVGLDVTGSMGRVTVAIRDALGTFMDMLLKSNFLPHPQVLFYAVGDAAAGDQMPFQVTQFESDNRINDQITKVVLEGGGGGGLEESYEVGYYFAARHTSIDCFEKRQKKGYLVTIGDEFPYQKVSKWHVKGIFDELLQEDIPLEKVVKEAQEKFYNLHIIPKGSSHFDSLEVRNMWTKVLGGKQFVLMLEDPTLTAETIALAIGLNEGAITLEEGLKLVSDKVGQRAAEVVRTALEDFASTVAGKAKPKPEPKKGKHPKKSETKKKDFELF